MVPHLHHIRLMPRTGLDLGAADLQTTQSTLSEIFEGL